jgi:putative transposase
MADTYSRIYIQIVLAVRDSNSRIYPSWENDLFDHIKHIVQKEGQKLLAINGMSDHVHVFVGIQPSCNLSELVKKIKNSTSDYIKDNQFVKSDFQWDEGFGAFSYGTNQFDLVTSFIASQKEHHTKIDFNEEYSAMLRDNNVIFNMAT